MPPSPLHYIRSSPFMALAYLVQRLTAQFAPQLRQWRMTPSMFVMLGYVNFEPGVSAADVARTCSMSPQHVAALLDNAEERGWIVREGVRARGQRSPLQVTPAATEILGLAWPIAQQVASPASMGMTDADFDHFVALLQRALSPEGKKAPTDDVVVLLDAQRTPCGTAPRASVHTHDTPLHAAFSTYLFDADNNLLMTRRALSKLTWPGVWTNSACGHLLPNETPMEAARRRVPQEIGARPQQLRMVLPDFAYRATDASGIVENEFCPVMVGRIDRRLVEANPEEIAELTWISWDTLVSLVDTAPALISPWCVEQVQGLRAQKDWQRQR